MKYNTDRLDGGSRGMKPTLTYTPMSGNHNGAQNVATTERAAELARLLRSAMNYSARQLLIELPPAKRSESESMFLKDCARDRRAVSDENLATLLVLQGRADLHALSNNIRELEVRVAAQSQSCPVQSLLEETEAQGQADVAQHQFVYERTPVRARALMEKLEDHGRRIRRAMDALAGFLGKHANA